MMKNIAEPAPMEISYMEIVRWCILFSSFSCTLIPHFMSVCQYCAVTAIVHLFLSH